MDETPVPVCGGRHYHHRAVDRQGKSVDSMLCDSHDCQPARLLDTSGRRNFLIKLGVNHQERD